MESIRDNYLNTIVKITTPVLNEEVDSSAAAEQFVSTFAIKDIKAVAMVRLMYHHLDLFARLDNEENHEFISHIIGLDLNVLADIAMDEWKDLANRLS